MSTLSLQYPRDAQRTQSPISSSSTVARSSIAWWCVVLTVSRLLVLPRLLHLVGLVPGSCVSINTSAARGTVQIVGVVHRPMAAVATIPYCVCRHRSLRDKGDCAEEGLDVVCDVVECSLWNGNSSVETRGRASPLSFFQHNAVLEEVRGLPMTDECSCRDKLYA